MRTGGRSSHRSVQGLGGYCRPPSGDVIPEARQGLFRRVRQKERHDNLSLVRPPYHVTSRVTSRHVTCHGTSDIYQHVSSVLITSRHFRHLSARHVAFNTTSRHAPHHMCHTMAISSRMILLYVLKYPNKIPRVLPVHTCMVCTHALPRRRRHFTCLRSGMLHNNTNTTLTKRHGNTPVDVAQNNTNTTLTKRHGSTPVDVAQSNTNTTLTKRHGSTRVNVAQIRLRIGGGCVQSRAG
jgi:hypothetical protein